MRLDALDYSFARPDIASMAAGGIRLVSRYLFADGPRGKGLTTGERDELHARGIAINGNYEARSGMVLEGPTTAVGYVETALGLAHDLGFPIGCSIDYSADRDIQTQEQYALLGKFFETANSRASGRPVGAYGEYDVIEWLWSRGLITHAWQTLAWSRGQVHPRASLYQFSINNLWDSAAVDFNSILNPAEAFRYAWTPAGAEDPQSQPTPVPIPVPQQEDDLMFELIQNSQNGEVRACAPGYWYGFPGASSAERIHKIRIAQQDPLCANKGVIKRVSPQGMQDTHDMFVGPGVLQHA